MDVVPYTAFVNMSSCWIIWIIITHDNVLMPQCKLFWCYESGLKLPPLSQSVDFLLIVDLNFHLTACFISRTSWKYSTLTKSGSLRSYQE